MSDRLESVQRQAMKIIYGYNVDCDLLVQNGKLETLYERRETAMIDFAVKNCDTERFGKKWFKKAPTSTRTVRPTTRKPFIEPLARTERMKNNPITYMTKLLNEKYFQDQ